MSAKIKLENIIYSDITPYINKKPDLAVNIDAILISIRTLLTTERGERLNLPQYGLSLSDYLWENVNDTTAWQLRTTLFDEITFWEPRVELNPVASTVTPLPEDKAFDVTLVMSVKGVPDSEFKLYGILKNIVSNV